METLTIKTGHRLPALILVLLAHFFAVAAIAQQPPAQQLGVAIISDPKTGTILLNARLNGDPVVMILDTGSSHSLFDARAFGMSPAQLQAVRLNTRGLGLNADVVWRSANFRIADQQWNNQPVEVADLSKLSKIHGRTIDGILGQDVLRSFDSVQINYKGDCVMLQR
jgi:predicted aspartyl protease